MHYTQCKMTNDKKQFHVAWIPSTLAKVGRHIEIKMKDVWSACKVSETWTTKKASDVERRGHDSTKGFGSVVK